MDLNNIYQRNSIKNLREYNANYDINNDIHGLKEIKTSLTRGYMNVNKIVIGDYKGRYGSGKIILSHCDISNKYMLITYYVKGEN